MTKGLFIKKAMICLVILCCTGTAFAWGPRTRLSVVNTVSHLLTREHSLPLTRLTTDLRAGASLSESALESMYPDMVINPLAAIENEIALLTAARGERIDPYFAFRLGALGSLVSKTTAPMRTADPLIRTRFYEDAEQALDTRTLKPAQRKTVDIISHIERVIREANAANDIIESEYNAGVGFSGAASSRLATDVSRSVNTVADVWWTVITTRALPGNISEEQLQFYVINAYSYYAERRNPAEIEAADNNYSKLVPYTPAMRARIGDLLFEADMRERAIREYEAVLAEDPSRRDIVEKIADYYMTLAEDALRNNRLEDGLVNFEKALQANGLHPTAEQRRLEVVAMIRTRDEQQQSYQQLLREAEELQSLAEEEYARNRYAEAVALLRRAQESLQNVGDEFPMETQKRARGLRDVEYRMIEVNQALFSNTSQLSGFGFGPDIEQIIEEATPGLEREMLDTLVKMEYENELKTLERSLQGLLSLD